MPPIVNGEQWDAAEFAAWHEHRGRNPTEVGVLAAAEYEHANEGHVAERGVGLWPWCPAWFSRFATGPGAARAERVIRLVRARESGDPGLGRGDELTPYGVDVVEIATRLWDGVKADIRKESEARGSAANGRRRRRGRGQ